MNQEQWNACTDPEKMLRFVLGTDARVQDVEAFPDCKASDRTLRLFACACYYHVRHLVPNPLAQSAVWVAERFADGLATEEELRRADARLMETMNHLEGPWRESRGAQRQALLPTHEAIALAAQITRPEAPKAAYYASSNAYLALAAILNPGVGTCDPGFGASQRAEEHAQAAMLRCILGPLPFHALPPPNPCLLAFENGLVVKLAGAAYEIRSLPSVQLDSARLAVLGDCLEEAGCTDTLLLDHLRSPGEHVRGCFAVDVLLEKR